MLWTLAAAILARPGQPPHNPPPNPSGGGGGGGGFLFFPFFLGGGGIGLLVLIVIGYFVLRMLRSPGSSSSMDSSPPPPIPPVAYPPAPAAARSGPGAAVSGAYDDSHPVGVPDRFRGEALPGSDPGAQASPVAEGLTEIKVHDPGFDEAAFTAQVERVYFVVCQAWTERKPELSRQVMADGIWQQHRTQIEQYIAQGRHNVMNDLAISRADIVGAHSDQTYDTVTVRIAASGSDYDADDKGKFIKGNRDWTQWAEDWVLQRSSQATTKADGGTMSHKCPNCGAPLDVDLAGVCSYCKAPVMSGKYDWVLTRIDQIGY
jgi:predicted lipid-binding transport protein (Tim44 family)